MREVRGKHIFPNISENLTSSLLKVKGAMLQMAASRVPSQQPVPEPQPDNEVQLPAVAAAIPAIPPVVTDITPVPLSGEQAINTTDRDTTGNTSEITPPSIQTLPGANITPLPGAA